MSRFFKKASLLLLIVLVPAGIVFSGEVIQTQESDAWEGIEADLTSLRISKNIVTVKVKLRNTGCEEQGVKIPYDACFIMDETNQKKYYPLKDSDGLYIAGPMADEQSGGRFWFGVQAGKARGLWIKFPEPTDGPETITISLAGIFPFEEIQLKSKE
jgi:hypothetical protein